MERKLAEYRAKKTQEKKHSENEEKVGDDDDDDEEGRENKNEEDWSKDSKSEAELGVIGRTFSKLYTINFLLKSALWFTLWMFFIKIEFGAVYFIVSLTFILYFSMRYNQRKEYEPSAYSVFNENFEKLEGTFTAEQFEKQMIYGGAGR